LVLTLWQLACGDEIVATFVPSRNSTPALSVRIGYANTPAKFPDPDPKVTRAYVVFQNSLATADTAAVREEALLSLLLIRQLAKLAAPTADWTSAMLAAVGSAGAGNM
jgi:hypothetical protein